MKCSNCGKTIADGRGFCNYFGAAISRDGKMPFVAKAALAYGLGKLTLDALNNTAPAKALVQNHYTEKYKQQQEEMKKRKKK